MEVPSRGVGDLWDEVCGGREVVLLQDRPADERACLFCRELAWAAAEPVAPVVVHPSVPLGCSCLGVGVE